MPSVTALIGRFKKGSQSAFALLVGQFRSGIARLANRRVVGWGAASQYGEDIAQQVFWELYRGVRSDGTLASGLHDTRTLQATLRMLTRRQVGRHWRDSTRECRDWRCTRSAADVATDAAPDPLDQFSHEKSVSWLREIRTGEMIEQLVRVLPDPEHREIVRLLLLGHKVGEIAVTLDCSVRGVQRDLVEIRSIWESHPQARELVAEHVAGPKATAADAPR